MFQKRYADEAVELRKAVINLDTIDSKRKKQEDAEFKEALPEITGEKLYSNKPPRRREIREIRFQVFLVHRWGMASLLLFDVLAFIYFISFIFN
jgi:hypothetical protein